MTSRASRALVMALAVAGTLAVYALRLPKRGTAPAASATAPPADEEAALLQGAEQALAAGNTERAFSLLYEAATKFPHGRLSDERELLHMSTLCRAGKAADARQEAADFLAKHPRSPLAARAQTPCR